MINFNTNCTISLSLAECNLIAHLNFESITKINPSAKIYSLLVKDIFLTVNSLDIMLVMNAELSIW